MQSPAATVQVSNQARPQPVASYAHTVGLLCIMFGAIAISLALQTKSTGNSTPSTASHGSLIPGYLESLAFDWGILYFAWVGVQQKGGSLFSLSGRRWTSLRDVLRDVAIAAPFWVIWEAVAHGAFALLRSDRGGSADAWTTPSGFFEVSLWFAVCATAGFCEELIFRGYLQRQLTALTGRVWAGILGQAILFGLIHPRGWRAVVVISLLGVLYGILAAWRKDLKPGMLAHGWSDVWEGWLKHVLHFPY